MNSYLTNDNPLYQEVYRMMQGDYSNYEAFYNLTINGIRNELNEISQDMNTVNNIVNEIYNNLYIGISKLQDASEYYRLEKDVVDNVVSKYKPDVVTPNMYQATGNNVPEGNGNNKNKNKLLAGICIACIAALIGLLVFGTCYFLIRKSKKTIINANIEIADNNVSIENVTETTTAIKPTEVDITSEITTEEITEESINKPYSAHKYKIQYLQDSNMEPNNYNDSKSAYFRGIKLTNEDNATVIANAVNSWTDSEYEKWSAKKDYVYEMDIYSNNNQYLVISTTRDYVEITYYCFDMNTGEYIDVEEANAVMELYQYTEANESVLHDPYYIRELVFVGPNDEDLYDDCDNDGEEEHIEFDYVESYEDAYSLKVKVDGKEVLDLTNCIEGEYGETYDVVLDSIKYIKTSNRDKYLLLTEYADYIYTNVRIYHFTTDGLTEVLVNEIFYDDVVVVDSDIYLYSTFQGIDSTYPFDYGTEIYYRYKLEGDEAKLADDEYSIDQAIRSYWIAKSSINAKKNVDSPTCDFEIKSGDILFPVAYNGIEKCIKVKTPDGIEVYVEVDITAGQFGGMSIDSAIEYECYD